MTSTSLVFFLFVSFFYGNEAARILSIYPTPSISHQVVFRAVTLELAKQGHDVVTITTDPIFTKQNVSTLGKITEIDVSYIYELMMLFKNEVATRGAIIDVAEINPEDFKAVTLFVDAAFENPAVKSLLADPNEKFDLIIAEALYWSPLILAKKYNAPAIWFSSFYGNTFNMEAMGAPSRHPLIYPNYYRYRFLNLSVWEKIYEIYIEFRIWYTFSKVGDYDIALVQKHFGIETTISELTELLDLLFINVNSIFEWNRPVPPNVIYLGGLHMMPAKPLPEDLQTLLDSSVNGVIYVSLGTNVYTSVLEPELIESFLKAFESLPYDILWKFDDEVLPRKVKNVHVRKWFPQRDLLGHPAIKAFVTQGGLQSLDEAIEAKVPIVGIPFLVDQTFNLEHCVRLGLGVKLDPLNFNANVLVNGINTVITEDSFRQNLESVTEYLYDQPQKPLDRAVWWVNYVLRHKGAKHLRSPVYNKTWSEYLMLDVVLTLLVIVITALTIVFIIVKRLYKLCTAESKKIKLN